jgi:homocysteine S-methyltransferase
MIDVRRPRRPDNPIGEFIRHQGIMVLDGGLATTLESRGCDLNDELWSAKILLEAPERIGEVSRDFLAAGADCIVTATYQASLEGLLARGLTEAQALDLLRQSVRLASDARDTFWSEPENRGDRRRPLVAASIGPYGAYLADGSEYTGDYDIGADELDSFHRVRWRTLAASEADLLGCETIPSRREAGVLLGLLRETPNRWAWVSFSCRDGHHLSDGSRLVDAARDCDAEPGVAAIGINCTAPEFVSSLIAEARRGTSKPVMVYPNSGEQYDAVEKRWHSSPGDIDWGEAPADWVRAGASVVGGCCRIGPEQIEALRLRLVGPRV